MALHWDITKVKDRENIPKHVIDAAVWLSMSVGMGSITEKNWEEFAIRVQAWQTMFGAYWSDGNGQPVFAEPHHIKMMVGLTTNVGNESRAKWQKRMMENLMLDAQREVNKHQHTHVQQQTHQ